VKTSSFSFELPAEAIAQQPITERGGSRLMVVDREGDRIVHSRIADLPAHVDSGTVLVLNKTRVIKARLYGTSLHGGQVEFLLLSELQPGLWRTLAAKSAKQLPGKVFEFPGGIKAQIVAEDELTASAGEEGFGTGSIDKASFRYLRFTPTIDNDYLESYGHVPLPPYIRRTDTLLDAKRYQTVFAEDPGSAAAPTAGLHFTDALLQDLQKKGVHPVKLTLHVGAGTFLPIRCEDVEKHKMHEEHYHIPGDTARRINSALREDRPILAVGTTVVRSLESAFCEDLGEVQAGAGRTSLFIYPGYRFKVVSQLLTNFHTPRSSLLVMVSAFAGRRRILNAYENALREGYRFFSYGDAMLIR
jgi:S-adenosylmethionine:tRNA ribosyltransferase-isomerase